MNEYYDKLNEIKTNLDNFITTQTNTDTTNTDTTDTTDTTVTTDPVDPTQNSDFPPDPTSFFGKIYSEANIPLSKNWVTLGKLPPVKEEGICKTNSIYAFTSAIESQFLIKHNL